MLLQYPRKPLSFDIETLPLEQAADAYARMMQGKARFGMVLVTG